MASGRRCWVENRIRQRLGGILFIVDSTARPSGERRLSILQGVMIHITPGPSECVSAAEIRASSVGALERARVARELHDSMILSLTAVEMQLDVAANTN